MKYLFLVIVMIVASSCYTASGTDRGGDSRFVGVWMVQETVPHGGYSASAYEFDVNGGLRLVQDFGSYSRPHGYVLGPEADDVLFCDYGEYWSSRGSDVLVIHGICSDDVDRDIELRIVSPDEISEIGSEMEVLSVGGESGWRPPAWGLAFEPCGASVEDCDMM